MFKFWLSISYITEPVIIVAILFTASLILWKYKQEKYAFVILFSSALALAITYSLKELFKIPRPIHMLIAEDGYSFPSGHATIAGVIFILIIYYSYLHIKNKHLKMLVNILAIIILVLICYSRLYLNVHYPVDIIIGSIIGIGSTIFVEKLAKHLRYFK